MLVREAVGEVLRRHRVEQERTLREVSTAAAVSLGYLSEVERGKKEASSELLASICLALRIPVPQLLLEVSRQLVAANPAAADPAVPVDARAARAAVVALAPSRSFGSGETTCFAA